MIGFVFGKEVNKFHRNFFAQRKQGSNLVISYLVCSPFIIAGVSGVPKISEVGSKQVGTELPKDLIMILINRSAVVNSRRLHINESTDDLSTADLSTYMRLLQICLQPTCPPKCVYCRFVYRSPVLQ